MAAPSPIPHVSQSLDPYILPRATVSSIRQSLHSHLERQLRLESTQTLSLANLTNPPLTQTLPEPPASVTGVRRSYWRALRAHQVAREKFEVLRGELERVGGANVRGAATEDGSRGGDSGELLDLLRAREKKRKLIAVGRAVEAVEREGNGVVKAKFDDVVKAAVGDVPVLPGQRGIGGGGAGREEGEMRVVELKKAVLNAKATIERCSESSIGGSAKASGEAELYALQKARNILIEWIERQLALIGGADEDEVDAASSPNKNGDDEEKGRIVSSDEITQLYEDYLEARATLLETVHEPQDVSPLAPAPETPKQVRSSLDNGTAGSTATTLLPFIEPLLATKSTEQGLIHQAAYVRRQLASSEAGTERLLRRLADESHLVHPGASRGRDWARAGEEAGEATREFVLEKAKNGEVSSRDSERLLGHLHGITGGLERLAHQGV